MMSLCFPWLNAVFEIVFLCLIKQFAFLLTKNRDSSAAMRLLMCGGVACEPGWKKVQLVVRTEIQEIHV